MHIVTEIGLETAHEIGYIVRRTRGDSDPVWLIMCLATDCMVQTTGGLERAGPGDCFIKSPEFIEYHYAPDFSSTGFVNDWMHVSSPETETLICELKLPVNELIHTHQPTILRPTIQRIINEKRGLHPFWEKKISNLVETALISVARSHQENQNVDSKQYEEVLLGLRNHLREKLLEQWTVEKMAKGIGLSGSHFSVLYKKRFGQSPIDDLIGMRLEQAKVLLLSTNSDLHGIAVSCGFQNEYYFSRIFKSREKVSPGAYRRQD